MAAIGKYVQRDEAALETHEGKIPATHDAVSAEMESWARDFNKRRPSEDVATFRLSSWGIRPRWRPTGTRPCGSSRRLSVADVSMSVTAATMKVAHEDTPRLAGVVTRQVNTLGGYSFA